MFLRLEHKMQTACNKKLKYCSLWIIKYFYFKLTTEPLSTCIWAVHYQELPTIMAKLLKVTHPLDKLVTWNLVR